MKPVLLSAYQDDHTPGYGDRTSTNLLVSLRDGGMKRVHSDGYVFWIKFHGQRYNVNPETLEATAA